jgi:hypothetical protein
MNDNTLIKKEAARVLVEAELNMRPFAEAWDAFSP